MATSAYITGRKKYNRPQGMLWANEPGTKDAYAYYPLGTEPDDFIVLSDHNRSEISLSKQRIETRQRMINGTMRSYHIDDKINISLSWSNLPSRAFREYDTFNTSTGLPVEGNYEYTADLGAGGTELVEWYETHSGPFWVFLSYDTNDTYKNDRALAKYNEIRHMYFSSFDYTVIKRSNSFDLWNVSVALEEV